MLRVMAVAYGLIGLQDLTGMSHSLAYKYIDTTGIEYSLHLGQSNLEMKVLFCLSHVPKRQTLKFVAVSS